MVDIQTVVYVLPILAFTLTLFYYTLNIRNANKSRQASILTSFQKEAHTNEYWRKWRDVVYHQDFTDYETWNNNVGPYTDSEEYLNFVSLGAYYEHLGVLVKQGFIDPKHIMETMSGPILAFWDKTEKVTKEARVALNNPLIHIEIENLVNYIKQQRKDYTPDYLASRH
jgi:hypothetical protein